MIRHGGTSLFLGPAAVADRASRLADALFGERVRASIDRRIRLEMMRHRIEQKRHLTAAMRSPEMLATLADEVARQLEAATRRAEEERRADQTSGNREFTTDVLFGTGRRYDRTLNPKRYARVAAEIRALTGASNVDWPMQQAFRSIVDSESRGLGRIAGSTYNIIGKLVAPPLLRPPPGPVLELGTLFGLFTPTLIRQFRRAGDFRTVTVVDPFAGTQIQPGTAGGGDPTGTPVTAEIALRNFDECGLRPEEVRVVQGYSTDVEVQRQVADRDYAVAIVDGDHSEEGVYRDLWWVQEVVLPGALVVMDDFGDPRWQGVERAGRRYLADGGRLQLLGTVSTSAYLQMPN